MRAVKELKMEDKIKLIKEEALKVINEARTMALLEEARRDAHALVTADPGLSSDEDTKLRRMMIVRYGKALELGDVG